MTTLALASLILSIVALVIAALGVWYYRSQAHASARAAEAAEAAAESARILAQNDEERRGEERGRALHETAESERRAKSAELHLHLTHEHGYPTELRVENRGQTTAHDLTCEARSVRGNGNVPRITDNGERDLLAGQFQVRKLSFGPNVGELAQCQVGWRDGLGHHNETLTVRTVGESGS